MLTRRVMGPGMLLGVTALAACAAPTLERLDRTDGDRDGTSAGEPSEWPTLSSPTIEGATVVEGDMVFENDSLQGIAASRTSTVTRWPNGVIPYEIEPDMPHPERVTEAAKQWLDKAGIRFVPRTDEADYVHFQNGEGCWAFFGKKQGKGIVTIQWDEEKKIYCTTASTVHEMGHVIGLAHEQSRSDRDDYLTIHWENIDEKKRHNFDKTNFQAIGAFDVRSIMRYPGSGFSKNGQPTMTAKDGTPLDYPTVISDKDAAGVKAYYAKELAGDNTDIAGKSSVSLTWSQASPTATYSLDVQTSLGEWIGPCVDSGKLQKNLSLIFNGACPSANKAVALDTVRAFRLYSAEQENWKDARFVEGAYRGETSLYLGP